MKRQKGIERKYWTYKKQIQPKKRKSREQNKYSKLVEIIIVKYTLKEHTAF